jgi:hypothetical protein
MYVTECKSLSGLRRVVAQKKGELKNAPRTHDVIENKHSEGERFPHTQDVDENEWLMVLYPGY